jgi:gliding motility-associated-like protein
LVLVCINFNDSFGQISVKNKCAVNYTTLSGGSSDPRTIYFNTTTFRSTEDNSTDWLWDFGDGSTGQGKIITHEYITPGVKFVTLKRSINGIPQPLYTQNITIELSPKLPQLTKEFDKRDTTFCDNEQYFAYKFGTAPSPVSYLWYPGGETTKTITISKSNIYSVRVKDNNTGCEVFASVKVSVCSDDKILPADNEYHFANNIIRKTNHGSTNAATVYPGNENYVVGGTINTDVIPASIENPNPFQYYRYLFTSDGNNVYGKNGTVVAKNISGGGGIFQSNSSDNTKPLQTIIIPAIEGEFAASTKYYVFTVTASGRLSYTLLDTRGKINEGDADAIEKNIGLLINMNGKIAVSPYFDAVGNYYFVAAGKDGKFYTFTVSKMGITGPVISNGVGAGKNETQDLRFSKDGLKLISGVSAPPTNEIYQFSFSPAGVIAPLPVINLGSNQELYGIEYSANTESIYYTINGNGPPELRKYQINTNQNALIFKGKNGQKFGSLKMVKAPGDLDEILMANNNESYLSSIYNSDGFLDDLALINEADSSIKRRNILVKFDTVSHEFPKLKTTLKLFHSVDIPIIISSTQAALKYTPACEGDDVKFEAQKQCEVQATKFEWIWGDGTPNLITSTQTASHKYNCDNVQNGEPSCKFNMKLLITYCSNAIPFETQVVVSPKPKAIVKPFYEMCFKPDKNGNIPELKIPVIVSNFDKLTFWYGTELEYEWNTGRTVRQLERDTLENITTPKKIVLTIGYLHPDPDIFSLTGTCYNKYEVDVKQFCPPTVNVPDIYTPNGDGTNDELKIIKDEVDNNNFEFRIYNRWGELVYFSKNKDEPNPWNGKFKGKDCEPDTYAWTVQYRSIFKPNGITYKDQGAIILVR